MYNALYRLTYAFALLALVLVVSGCDSNDPDDETPVDLEVTRFDDLPADPFTGVGPDGRPVGTGRYTFFSLRDNQQVPVSDSASADWDIAFRGTDVLVNGGTSGPGNGAAQVLDGIFEDLAEAPEAGWAVDGAQGPAVPLGSGNGWYNYNPATMIVSPIPGRILLLRTADGLYAKMRIVSYYRGAPDPPTAQSEARYFTLEYVLQPDGTRRFQ